MTRQPTPQGAQRYAEAVVRILAGDFTQLADRTVGRLVTECVARQAEAPLQAFEVIVDSPTIASWRLMESPDDYRRVVLVCCRLHPRARHRVFERRINAALRSIPEA